jgi:hypothetical protein
MKRFAVLDRVTAEEFGEIGDWDEDLAVSEWQGCMTLRLGERFPGVKFLWEGEVPDEIRSLDHEERGWREVDDDTAEDIAEAEREIGEAFLYGDDHLWVDAVNAAMAEQKEESKANGDAV